MLHTVSNDQHTHTHSFIGPFSGNTQVSQYQKGKTNPDFTEARDSEWQWHQLDHMQVCTSLQADNHASSPPLSSLQAGCPSCRPTNSVKALKAINDQCNNNFVMGMHHYSGANFGWHLTDILCFALGTATDFVYSTTSPSGYLLSHYPA